MFLSSILLRFRNLYQYLIHIYGDFICITSAMRYKGSDEISLFLFSSNTSINM